VRELQHLQAAARRVIDGVVSGEIPPQTGAVVNDAIQVYLELIDLEDKLEPSGQQGG